MANPQRYLDVWIVETNTVYKEVPYSVVADWLQQGRLLEDDRAKPAGSKDWHRLGDMPDFQPYLLRPEPFRPDDEAEALEPVVLDFAYKKRHDDEDDDVDMIPLIDVSLVLLVFFMLTASSVAMSSYVNTPETTQGLMVDDNSALRIDINIDQDGAPVYALGVGSEPPGPEVHTLPAILNQLQGRLAKTAGGVDLVINAHRDVKAKVPRDLLLALRSEPFRSKISANYYGVSEKREP